MKKISGPQLELKRSIPSHGQIQQAANSGRIVKLSSMV